MPELKINKVLKGCIVCNIEKSKFKFPNPGGYNDCLLSSNFITSPEGEYLLGIRKDRNILDPIRTFRVFNQKSQFLVFVNENYEEKYYNVFKMYNACNGHFIKIFEPKHISKRMVFIIRNAAYYTFITTNYYLIDRVISFDFADTIFLDDPFGILERDSLYLSTENIKLVTERERIVVSLYEKVHGKKCDLNGTYLVNGGTVAGYHTFVAQFLRIFLNYFVVQDAYEDDQWYFNMIQYCVPYKGFNVKLLNNTKGFNQYCDHFEKFTRFPPNMPYPVSLFHFYNRPDCGSYNLLMIEKCTNYTKTISYS